MTSSWEWMMLHFLFHKETSSSRGFYCVWWSSKYLNPVDHGISWSYGIYLIVKASAKSKYVMKGWYLKCVFTNDTDCVFGIQCIFILISLNSVPNVPFGIKASICSDKGLVSESHHLDQWWYSLLTHICIIWLRSIKGIVDHKISTLMV